MADTSVRPPADPGTSWDNAKKMAESLLNRFTGQKAAASPPPQPPALPATPAPPAPATTKPPKSGYFGGGKDRIKQLEEAAGL